MTQPPGNPYHPNQPPGPPQPGVPSVPPDHPQAVTVLILGILGIALCQLVAPVAWVMGARVRREIAESRGELGGSTQASVGWALGLAGSILLIAIAASFLLYAVLAVGMFAVIDVETTGT